jgi:predicted enzyme related to lactoylglutathione lyase
MPETQGGFTGEILPVFYVSDVRKSVQFYRDVLGFEFHHYWDYDENEQVREWKDAEPPIYAEMAAGDQKFALHLAQTPYETQVGGVIHYFRVQDVSAHYRQVKSQGGEPGPLISRPWMHMFSIVDADGHRIFFYTPPDG